VRIKVAYRTLVEGVVGHVVGPFLMHSNLTITITITITIITITYFKFVMACEYEIFGKFPRTTGSVEKHSVG